MAIVEDGRFVIPRTGVNGFGCSFKVILFQLLSAEWKLGLWSFNNIWNRSTSMKRQSQQRGILFPTILYAFAIAI